MLMQRSSWSWCSSRKQLDRGARYSEIANLKFDAIDLATKTINLWRDKVDNESRLYMTDRVYEVLSRRHGGKRASQIYVFENSDKDGPRKYAPKAFMNACERAGIEGITLHSMRRTHASRLVQAGMPIYDVSKLLGHASVTTTANHYAHLAPNQSSRAATDILNRIGESKGRQAGGAVGTVFGLSV